MATTLQIRIDEKTKQKAQKLFLELGTDISSAIKLFITQALHERAIPFRVQRSPKEIRAEWDKEVKEILKSGKKYTSTKEMFDDIMDGPEE